MKRLYSSFTSFLKPLCWLIGLNVFFFTKLSANGIGYPGTEKPAAAYSFKVLENWMTLQIKLMSTTPASFNGPFVRVYGYTSIATYLSLYPSIPENSPNWFSLSRLNQLRSLPEIDNTRYYHWPSSVNAALANMTRLMFPFTNADNRRAIDSLENAITHLFEKEPGAETAASYGKRIAQIVYEWAQKDGYLQGNDSYTPRSGPASWRPTAPSFAKAVTPYWGDLRSTVIGSMENTQPLGPIPYSEDPESDFYKAVKQVFDITQNISDEQKEIAFFWRDINPGVTAPGHWMNIIKQILKKENASLDKAAFVFVLTGMALNDAWISSWKTRYVYNLLRPITYVRSVMGQSEWLPLLSTPPHPEYPSGFATMAGAVTQALSIVFGKNYRFTDHTYDYLGMKPRSFRSFDAMAKEAGMSKLYGGIHYQFSIETGLQQGREVAQNISAILLNNGKPVPPKQLD